MTKSKLTKYAFNLADTICWLFVVIAILNIIFTFITSNITMWSISGLSETTNIILEFINTIFSGLGFYLIIKRKIIGFALVVVTSVFTLLASRYIHIYTVYLLITILIIIGLPWALSYKEVINAKTT